MIFRSQLPYAVNRPFRLMRAIELWLDGRIGWYSVCLVARTDQPAVCGKGGAYFVDREEEETFCRIDELIDEFERARPTI